MVFLDFLKQNKDAIDVLMKLVGGFFAIFGAQLAFRRYREDKDWRNKQFAFDYYEKMSADPDVRLALQMIDWSEKKLSDLDAGRLGVPVFTWSHKQIELALRTHADGDFKFTAEEVAIRYLFDSLLDKWERFSSFKESHIIEMSDIPPTAAYYFRILNENRYSEFKAALDKYMEAYGYKGVKKMISEFAAFPGNESTSIQALSINPP